MTDELQMIEEFLLFARKMTRKHTVGSIISCSLHEAYPSLINYRVSWYAKDTLSFQSVESTELAEAIKIARTKMKQPSTQLKLIEGGKK